MLNANENSRNQSLEKMKTTRYIKYITDDENVKEGQWTVCFSVAIWKCENLREYQCH